MDVLRGFALFGIFIVNIKSMVGPLSNSITGTDLKLTGADLWADAAVYILAYGKFYLLFSLLFGMGFAVMMTRAETAGRRFFQIYLRRIVVLFFIGLAHGVLIWAGDILVSYSIFGLVLLLFFRKTPQSRLPKWALVFYLGPVLLVMLGGLIGSLVQFNARDAAEFFEALAAERTQMLTSIEAQRLAYGGGTYLEITRQAVADTSMVLGYMAFAGWLILAMFLLGAWFIRSGAMSNPETHSRLYNRLAWFGLPVGLVLVLWSFRLVPSFDMTRMDMEVGLANAMTLVGAPLMSLGYLAWIVKGLQSTAWARRLNILAPVGRMALTNYLLQSLVCTLIFYNHGLGYFEQLPRAWQIPFVIALFSLQVIASNWWLKRFQFGPVEWLWRTLTYMQMPAMRKKPTLLAGAAFEPSSGYL